MASQDGGVERLRLAGAVALEGDLEAWMEDDADHPVLHALLLERGLGQFGIHAALDRDGEAGIGADPSQRGRRGWPARIGGSSHRSRTVRRSIGGDRQEADSMTRIADLSATG